METINRRKLSTNKVDIKIEFWIGNLFEGIIVSDKIWLFHRY